jgi:hypothetical protein
MSTEPNEQPTPTSSLRPKTGGNTFLSFQSLTYVLPHLNRSELCKRSGLSYQTISGKLFRFNNGQDVSFTKEQSQAIRDYLFEVMEKLELILIEEES